MGIENGFSKSALMALQEAAESYLVDLFEQSSLCTIHNKRVTLHPRYINLALTVKGEKQY
jgi:histone H3